MFILIIQKISVFFNIFLFQCYKALYMFKNVLLFKYQSNFILFSNKIMLILFVFHDHSNLFSHII